MSRIGKQPVIIPEGVNVNLTDSVISITGPKGVLSLRIPQNLTIAKQDNAITVNVLNPEDGATRALWGTTGRLISNAITGVTKGFSKKLIITGVGYRAHLKDKTLVLEVGFTHPVEFKPEDGITVALDGTTIIIISGIDKQRVGEYAARIRGVKKPEPYKGKGIAYEGEVIQRKAGKQAAGAAK
ncbi:MAG: 50S ribosomal protein L6 [Candidatus Jacksonbacteria bacterium]|nr:50S ribosomal protein L6 [Candidatus Jacksonbacteria bacterium]